jgi:hypothetical protein
MQVACIREILARDFWAYCPPVRRVQNCTSVPARGSQGPPLEGQFFDLGADQSVGVEGEKQEASLAREAQTSVERKRTGTRVNG